LCGAPRDDIIIFYLNKLSHKIHVRIHPIDRSPPIDRPAAQVDRRKYPKQWDAFRFSEDVKKGGNGMPDNQAVQPLVPIPTLQSQPQSPQAIAELRRYIAALQQQKPYKGMFYTWANGLDDMSRSLTAAMLSNRADELERQRLRTSASGDLPENPYSGNSSAAAPGGAGAVSPFSTQQTGSGEGTPDLTFHQRSRRIPRIAVSRWQADIDWLRDQSAARRKVDLP
jgi:hypothetical protein